jgi:hypothetical protein
MQLSQIITRVKAIASPAKRHLPVVMAGAILALGIGEAAYAVGTLGTSSAGQALKGAYDSVNDLSGGYGKALVMGVAFVATLFGILATQATGPILKFIGVAVFASMGLTAGMALAGGLI